MRLVQHSSYENIDVEIRNQEIRSNELMLSDSRIELSHIADELRGIAACIENEDGDYKAGLIEDLKALCARAERVILDEQCALAELQGLGASRR